MTASPSAGVTAALLVIGDEILSGRTRDKNVGAIAERLAEIGVDLREVRIVPDVAEEIVAAVNALRARYTYLFTTGGIGPTHDDITADAVAAAFGVELEEHPEIIAMMPDCNAHGPDPSWKESEDAKVQQFFDTLHEGYVNTDAERLLVQDTT